MPARTITDRSAAASKTGKQAERVDGSTNTRDSVPTATSSKLRAQSTSKKAKGNGDVIDNPVAFAPVPQVRSPTDTIWSLPSSDDESSDGEEMFDHLFKNEEATLSHAGTHAVIRDEMAAQVAMLADVMQRVAT